MTPNYCASSSTSPLTGWTSGKRRAEFANEFENAGLTAKLIGTKRGTNDRQIALEDVFDKVIVSSKLDDMNQLRSTLLKSGKEGRQAWSDLKAAGIERIK